MDRKYGKEENKTNLGKEMTIKNTKTKSFVHVEIFFSH